MFKVTRPKVGLQTLGETNSRKHLAGAVVVKFSRIPEQPMIWKQVIKFSGRLNCPLTAKD